MKLRTLLMLATLATLGLVAASATAASPQATTCSDGNIAAGTYKGLIVTGTCTFTGDRVKVNGDLVVAPGGSLNDHAVSTTEVHVTGDVIVGDGGILGLGTYNPDVEHKTQVGGSIIATNPTSLYVSFVRVHGDFISSGGSGPGRNYPTKDDTIDGNLSITGWTGFWVGLVRDTVGGSVTFSNNSGDNPDSSEVMTNVIGGNLICTGNTPAATVNPEDGGMPNVVGGTATGECAGLTG
jgi:hypothetical protein